MDRHDATEQDARAMRLGVQDLMSMAREWEVMFGWIQAAQKWVPTSVENFNRGAKSEMEEKLQAADQSATNIAHTLADFRAKIAAVRAVVAAADVYEPPLAPEPIRVPQKEPEAVKDDGEVLEEQRIEGKFGDMHLIQIKKMPNGGIEEWVDGKFYKNIYDYAEQKAAEALQAATEATARLKRQNERAAVAKQEKEANAARAAEAAKEKEARDAESRKSRYSGHYSLLQDAGSRQDDDYSAVRASEALVKERVRN